MKQLLHLTLLIFSCLYLTGCAKYHDSLVNPETKEGVNCVAEGWGWLGTPLAASSSNKCIKIYSAAGYIPTSEYIANGGKLEDLKAASVVFTSDVDGATIYGGAADGGSGTWTRLVNKTPWVLLLNSQYVLPECYKASLDGKESEVICFKERDRVRRVHFKFK